MSADTGKRGLTGRDGDDAQDWLAGWDNWLVNGGLRWVGWDDGGVVVDGWDGGGGEVRGGRGDGGSGWAVGDSSIMFVSSIFRLSVFLWVYERCA